MSKTTNPAKANQKSDEEIAAEKAIQEQREKNWRAIEQAKKEYDDSEKVSYQARKEVEKVTLSLAALTEAKDIEAAKKVEASKEEIAKKAEQKTVDLKTILDGKITAACQGNDKKNDYLPEEGEKHLFHVELDKPHYSQKDGKKQSRSYIQMFTSAEWNQFKNTHKSNTLGFEYKIKWNPEYFIA